MTLEVEVDELADAAGVLEAGALDPAVAAIVTLDPDLVVEGELGDAGVLDPALVARMTGLEQPVQSAQVRAGLGAQGRVERFDALNLVWGSEND